MTVEAGAVLIEVTVTVLTPGHCVPPVGLAVALVSTLVSVADPPVGLAVALVSTLVSVALPPIGFAVALVSTLVTLGDKVENFGGYPP